MSDTPQKLEPLSTRQEAEAAWASLEIWGPALIVVLLGFVVAYVFFVPPPPPQTITIATGSADGMYFEFAKKYQEELKKLGFELKIIETEGSVENVSLLQNKSAMIGFVQGGTAYEKGLEAELESVASLYFEPIWIFYRGDKPIQRLSELKGKRINLGPQGSGTHSVAVQILEENGISEDADLHSYENGPKSEKMLLEGQLDAAFYVTAARDHSVHDLLEKESMHLVNIHRARAYKRIHPFLSSVILAEGQVDLEHNLPPEDTILLASAANLVVRKDTHRAVVSLFLNMAQKVHHEGGMFEHSGEFPNKDHLDLPLAEESRRFFMHGPNILQRYLPFWLASLLGRMKVMLLPLFTLLIPLAKIAPPVYRWRIRSKIYRWYRLLREVDQELLDKDKVDDPKQYTERLESIEIELAKVWVPLSYMEEFYNLRVHIELIRDRVAELAQTQPPTSSPVLAPAADDAVDAEAAVSE